MKYATLALLGIALAIGSTIAQGQAPAPAPKAEPKMETVEQRFAYAYGLNFGRNVKQAGVMLDPDIVARGIKDGMADKSAFTEPQLQEIDLAFRKLMMDKDAAKQAATAGPAGEKNLKAGQEFLAANKSKPGIKVLPSGVQYRVLKSGTGRTPKLSDTVEANYRGTLIDGTEFDSSAKGGKPVAFGVSEVIPGWTEVLQLMKEGDKWQVFIPAESAYKGRQMGPLIKPFSTLIFEMEVVKIADDK